jgi:tetratricopeptide (TPR) repeat protein
VTHAQWWRKIVEKVTPPSPPAPPPAPPSGNKDKTAVVRKAPETKKVEARRETASRLRDEKAYAKRAKERLDGGDLDGAIADYTQAIALSPEFVEAYANRGVCRERKGDLAGAKADYAKSIEIQIRAEIARQIKSQEDRDI